jgi:hypothetical protein
MLDEVLILPLTMPRVQAAQVRAATFAHATTTVASAVPNVR